LKLTYEERHSALWVKLAEHLEARLDLLRAKNDNPIPAEETSRLRGQIREVKSLLALGQPETTVDAD
jgi:hypothetical protein